jgi:tRNA threonylcarbamoyl adenosine modification protein YeaZ
MTTAGKYGLAIHTGSPELGFAIDDGQGDQRSAAWNLGRDASNQLHQRLLEFLPPQNWQSLAYIAVAIGPGGFTGTRLGVVLGRTLAQQLDLPLFGVSSLLAIAASMAQSEQPIAIQMPAQRSEIHGGIYQFPNAVDYKVLQADQIFTPASWDATLAAFPSAISHTALPEQGRYAPALLTIAQHRYISGERSHWSTVLPHYGQHPVAVS